MQNQAFYRTEIFGNFFFDGGEFCVFKTGIPGGPVDDLERRNSPYFAFFSPNSIALLANYVTAVEDRPTYIITVKYCLSLLAKTNAP